MNKFITGLLVCVVVAAVAMVTLFHGEKSPNTEARVAATSTQSTPTSTGDNAPADSTTVAGTTNATEPQAVSQTTEPQSPVVKNTEPKTPPVSVVRSNRDRNTRQPVKPTQQQNTPAKQTNTAAAANPQSQSASQSSSTASTNATQAQATQSTATATSTPAANTQPTGAATQEPIKPTNTASSTSSTLASNGQDSEDLPPSAAIEPKDDVKEEPKKEELPNVVMTVTKGSGTMQDLSLHFSGNSMYLTIEGSGPVPVKFFTLPSPERLVIDLPGSWKGLKPPTIPSNQLVKSARIGRFKDSDRIVLDLNRPLKETSSKRYSQEKVEIHFE